MPSPSLAPRDRLRIGGLAGLLALLSAPLPACRATSEAPPGTLVVVKEMQASWVRNFNPFAVAGGSRWPTNAGIYEPLLIYNSVAGEYVPWLAESWAWEVEGEVLRFDLRPGVRWSDGEAFDAEDVVFTFGLLEEHPALDVANLAERLDRVSARDAHTVVIELSEPFVPGLPWIAHQSIVPEHRWRDIADPVTFTNPEPVGTGPFTEVSRFTTQVYELRRNPHYWQADAAPGVEALRLPALPSNEQANLALIHGEIDWTGTFIPAVDRVFVGRDPEHHHYWFPLVGSTIFLYLNTARPELAEPRVRKALSLAVDRELIVRIGMHNTTRPADPTGLTDAHRSWRDPEAAAAGDWVAHDPARAAALLDAAGWTLDAQGRRRNAAGEALSLELQVVSGWSDWVRAAQIIVQGLQELGVDASVKSKDFGAWMEALARGEFSASLGWASEGPTPYNLYQGLMSAEGVVPVGESANTNWHRYGSEEVDVLLGAFERTTDPALQQALVRRMQWIFVEEAPAIPVFPSPSWGQYNTRRFEGFPSAEDPYARLSPHKAPESLLVLTRIRARATGPVAPQEAP